MSPVRRSTCKRGTVVVTLWVASVVISYLLSYGAAFTPCPARRFQAFPSRSLPATKPHIIERRAYRTPPRSSLQDNDGESTQNGATLLDYVDAMRPITIIQAVGALIVGRLAMGRPIQPIRLLAASLSVYLSYGAGMAMNDCVDVHVDFLDESKQDRAIASGRISKRAGWNFCGLLSTISLLLAQHFVGKPYAVWTGINLILMLGYALGLQRLFLVKNILCGWLAVSPLIGAALVAGGSSISSQQPKLFRLAAVGFPMQLSREILKDIEDVDIDRGNKVTLPLVAGERASHRIAYGLVGTVCSVMILTPIYWNMFRSQPPVYAAGVIVGLPMCLRAATLPLRQGQRLLKKSIYVLLVGMIGGLLLQ